MARVKATDTFGEPLANPAHVRGVSNAEFSDISLTTTNVDRKTSSGTRTVSRITRRTETGQTSKDETGASFDVSSEIYGSLSRHVEFWERIKGLLRIH